jgi:hypothetical protein
MIKFYHPMSFDEHYGQMPTHSNTHKLCFQFETADHEWFSFVPEASSCADLQAAAAAAVKEIWWHI